MKKCSKMIAVIVVVVFVLQSLLVYGADLSGETTSAGEIRPDNLPPQLRLEEDNTLTQDERAKKLNENYSNIQQTLAGKSTSSVSQSYETDDSVEGVRVDESPADGMLYVTGRSVSGAGCLISIVIKDKNDHFLYSTSQRNKDSGNFKVSIPRKLIPSKDYKVIVKSRKRFVSKKSTFMDISNSLKDDSDISSKDIFPDSDESVKVLPTVEVQTSASPTPTVDLQTSASPAPMVDSQISDSPAPTVEVQTSASPTPTVDSQTPASPTVDLQTFDSPGATVDSQTVAPKVLQRNSYTPNLPVMMAPMRQIMDGITLQNARFVDSNGIKLTGLNGGTALYFTIDIKNTNTAVGGTMYLRLFNSNGDFVQGTSINVNISSGGNFYTYTAGPVNLPSGSLTGYYATAEIVNGDNVFITDTYRFPLQVPQNLDGRITFKMVNSQLSGEKVMLTWDEVPGALRYELYRDGDLFYSNITTNEYLGNYESGEAPLADNGRIYTFTVKAYSADNETTASDPVQAAKGDIYIHSACTLASNCLFEKLHLQPDTADFAFDLNGKVIKTYGVFEVGIDNSNAYAATLDMHGGQIFVLNRGNFRLLGKSMLKMKYDSDYMFVEGNFEFSTSAAHDTTTNLIDKGTIEVKSNFNKTVQNTGFQLWNGNSSYDSSNVVALTGSGSQTVGFGADTKSKFNILRINKPFNSGYIFNNNRSVPELYTMWCRSLDTSYLKTDQYSGINGVYPPTGNFSRTYADMSLDAPGLDINIARTYNSTSVNKEPVRGWTLGPGWSFSYEGCVENEIQEPTGTPTPTSSSILTPSPTPGITHTKDVRLPGGETLRFSYTSESGPFTAEDSRAELTKSGNVYTLTMKDRTKYEFTIKVSGRTTAWLTCIKDAYGNKTDISVEDDGRVKNIKDNVGRCFKVVYDSGNHIVKVEDYKLDPEVTPTLTPGITPSPAVTQLPVRKVEYSYNDAGLLSEIRDTLSMSGNSYKGNLVYRYTYNSLNFLTGIKDGYDQPIESVEYNSNSSGKVYRQKDAFGKSTAYSYENNRTTVTESSSTTSIIRTTTHDYDENLAVTTTTYADFDSTHPAFRKYIVEYEKYGGSKNKYNEIKYVTDRNGNKTEYVRDTATGNVTEIRNPDYSSDSRSAKKYGYYTDDAKKNLLKWEKDEEGNYTYYKYDDTRQLLNKCVYRKRITDSSTPEYDGTNGSSFILTTYEYYSPSQCLLRGYAGDLISAVTVGADERTEYDYDESGNLTLETEKVPTGTDKVTMYGYDDTRKQNLIRKPYKRNTSNEPVYSVVYNTYDTNGRLLKSELYSSDNDSEKCTTRYVYDAMGRLIQKITPKLYNANDDNIASYDYNNKNVGYRYVYYGSTGKLSKSIDAENNETKYHKYDIFGNLVIEQKPPYNTIDGTQSTAYVYTYDNMDRQTGIYRAKAYTVNNDGSITINEADKELIEEYNYTAWPLEVSLNNYLEVKTHIRHFDSDNSAADEYRYDYAGRLCTTVHNPGNSPITVQNTYYLNGQPESMQDMMGYTTYYGYGYENESSSNPTGRTVEHTWTPSDVNSTNHTVQYTYQRAVYDDAGNKASDNVRKAKVDSDASGPLNRSTIESESAFGGIAGGYFITQYLYYENGQPLEMVDFTNSQKCYSYDEAGNLSRVEEYRTSDICNITEYLNNFMGKPDKKIVNISRKGDLYGYSYTNEEASTLEYVYQYDKDGNNTILYDPLPLYSSTFFYYDNLDRQYAKGRSTMGGYYISSSTLNWAGNPVTETDYNGRTTTYKYNWKGLVSEVHKDVKVWENGSDVLRDCVTQYDYDRVGRKTVEVSPRYYNAGNPQDASNRLEYTYDSFDRVIKKRFYGQETKVNSTWELYNEAPGYKTLAAYEYDNNGNVTRETRYENGVEETGGCSTGSFQCLLI